MSSQNGHHPEQNIHPESNGSRTFHWNGLMGQIHIETDEFEKPVLIVVIRDGEEDAPATVGVTGTSSELAESSLMKILEELR